ncbi:MAG TPA: pitrilysin family protein [Bacteroidales bacterium]|nr:pitrilysin family protein [Bacteroidales bacterium]
MKTKLPAVSIVILSVCLISGCTGQKSKDKGSAEFKIEYEKFTLDNGLNVLFHTDRSDPVVAVSLTCHVGSARELPGKTGFAHLFEHLLFNESENLGRGGLDNLSARVGGNGANGSTSRDRTNYFQTVPNDALEKMLWAEADKLGWFINTVTEPVLAKEKQVVKNEKRQGVDNMPYGHTSYVLSKNLYPEGHPYNWDVIGSLEDLTSASLQDVKDFYNKWYVPNNVTLVVAGDFDSDQARIWVEKYFGEIKRGEEIPDLKREHSVLAGTKKLYYEDNFARLPELNIVWPTVHEYHPDSYALEILGRYLSQGKRAPLYKVLVEDKKLTSNVRVSNNNGEVAGEMYLVVRAFRDVDLNDVRDGIDEAFAEFEKNGIPEKDLNRIKAGQESAFYSGLSSVLGKSNQLAHYNIFAGDPGFVTRDVNNILNVTREDVARVYDQYIKETNFVATSFVPEGQSDLILEGSQPADIVEENIKLDVGEGFDVNEIVPYERTPSNFDRTIEPPYGESPEVTVPEIWTGLMDNGLKVFGIEDYEVPLVQFNFNIKGGLLLDDPDMVGVANMTASLMNRGTMNRTPEELEEAIEELGARISFRASAEDVVISGSTLSRNYEQTMALVREMLLEPRWDEAEFELIRQSIISNLQQQKASPNSVASNEYRKLIYGEHIMSNNLLGTEESVASISITDLKEYYDSYLSPSVTNLHVVGAISRKAVLSSLEDLDVKWESKTIEFPEYEVPSAPDKSTIYFYNIPGAKQSVFYIGYPCMSVDDPDFYPATVMNYILGGGGFASRLTQQLRQEKGYTYGIRSSFTGSTIPGPFTISSSVKTSITYEATSLVKEILENYPEDYSDEDLQVTKGFLIKSNARAFETMGAKLNMLRNISEYGWSYDYVKQREEIVRNMTLDNIKSLAKQYADPGRMIYLIVGDADTQLGRLMQLGYGEPVLIND